jgi:hypothetical protein
VPLHPPSYQSVRPREDDAPFRAAYSIGGNTTGTVIFLPGWIHQITATAIPNGGTACTVQHTTHEDLDLLQTHPTNAAITWVDWDAGTVTTRRSQSSMTPLVAVRLVTGAGAGGKIEVVGARVGVNG